MKTASGFAVGESPRKLFITCLLIAAFLTSVLFMLQPGYAQEAASDSLEDVLPLPTTGGGTTPGCTVDSAGNETEAFKLPKTYIISRIVQEISLKLSLASAQIYNKLIFDSAYRIILMASFVLYISIYGILFMTGMIPISLHDFIIRLLKIGVVVMLLTPTSFEFFSSTVVKFFNEGANDIINFFTKTGDFPGRSIPVIGPIANTASTGQVAFLIIDGALSKIVSSKLFVTIMSTSLTNVYGFLMDGLLLWGIWLFLQSLFTALWVYIMSLVLKSLLFGLAPIFIPTILFQRTRHLFDNWLNQIVNATLQPILLFIFYVFFVKLMEGSLDQILSHPVCWTKLPEGYRGSPFDFIFWRFAERGPSGWRPSQNSFGPADAAFPIPIIELLSFLLIADIANNFNKVVIQISNTLAQASVNLATGNPIDSARHAMAGGGNSLAKLNNSGLGPAR